MKQVKIAVSAVLIAGAGISLACGQPFLSCQLSLTSTMLLSS